MRGTSLRNLATKVASRALTQKLVSAVRSAEGGTPTARLWAEAYEAVVDPLKSLFEEVENGFPAKVRAPKHWAILIDRLEQESEDAVNRQWLGDGSLPDPDCRIARFAEKNDWDLRDCLDVWLSQGAALRDAVEELEIDLSSPHAPVTDLIGVCKLCWRTGEPAKRGGGFYCEEHSHTGSGSYQKALDRVDWRSPQQPLRPRVSFIWHHVRIVRALLPRQLIVEPLDLIPMAKLCRGEQVEDWKVRYIMLDLRIYAPKFKRVNRYYEMDRVRPDAQSQMKFLAAVDPKLPTLSGLQERMHQVMVQDNRILLDRLIYAEACLEADAQRRSNRGPGSAISAEEAARIVVPYTFSYSCLDSVLEAN